MYTCVCVLVASMKGDSRLSTPRLGRGQVGPAQPAPRAYSRPVPRIYTYIYTNANMMARHTRRHKNLAKTTKILAHVYMHTRSPPPGSQNVKQKNVPIKRTLKRADRHPFYIKWGSGLLNDFHRNMIWFVFVASRVVSHHDLQTAGSGKTGGAKSEVRTTTKNDRTDSGTPERGSTHRRGKPGEPGSTRGPGTQGTFKKGGRSETEQSKTERNRLTHKGARGSRRLAPGTGNGDRLRGGSETGRSKTTQGKGRGAQGSDPMNPGGPGQPGCISRAKRTRP